MTDSSLVSPTALLCTGRSLPLHDAALCLAELDAMVHDAGDGRRELFLLRECCLGRPLADDDRRTLIDAGILDVGGTPPPALKEVVLAAVRGNGIALTVDLNPFVDDWTRVLVDLIRCQERVREKVSDVAVGDRLLCGVPDPRFEQAGLPPSDWAGRVRRQPRRPGSPD